MAISYGPAFIPWFGLCLAVFEIRRSDTRIALVALRASNIYDSRGVSHDKKTLLLGTFTISCRLYADPISVDHY